MSTPEDEQPALVPRCTWSWPGARRSLPRRRPLQLLRGRRDPADVELRPHHPGGCGRPDPLRDDLHRAERARVDRARHGRRPRVRRDGNAQHGGPARTARRTAPGVRTGLNLLLLVAFGLKAAVFPLFFWLPDSYPAGAQPGHRGVRRAAHQGRGVRHRADRDACCSRGACVTLLFVIAGLTMIVGVLGAIAQSDMKRILTLPHREPDRLHDHGGGARRSRGDRGDHLLPPPPDPDQDVAVPRRRHRRATPSARAGSAR